MFFSKYIKIDAVETLTKTIQSRGIREQYQIQDVMFVKSGGVRNLLSQSKKFDMTNGKPIKTLGMYLSPSNEAGDKINTCHNATKICRVICLKNNGHMKYGENTRIQKTRFFYGYPMEFLNILIGEIVSGSQAISIGVSISTCPYYLQTSVMLTGSTTTLRIQNTSPQKAIRSPFQ